VDGDLVTAISRARQIDDRIEHCRTSGHCSRRVGHRELVDSYLVDLDRRADAGEIDPRTVRRYSSTLTLHYLRYSEQTDVERQFLYIAGVNRKFALGFATYLKNVVVRPNGHPNCRPRLMQGQAFVADIAPIIAGSHVGQPEGLSFLRRRVMTGRQEAPLRGRTRADLVAEFDRRRTQVHAQTASGERHIRDAILREAGGINYDHVVGEFAKLHRRLQWPGAATLKDFRHLYSTCLENSGVPEFYRKYLLGQSPGRAAIVTYTHLNKIREHYQRAIDTELKPLVEAVACRHRELDINTIDISEEFDNAQVQEST